ncbi:MAG TPA: hypothetical protein VKA95_01705 [Nitrososphaeraceae archaeon]|nr:hypothetical protein [Nitrososphaeraceae archaeon]
MNLQNIINLLKIANNNIPSVGYRYQRLTREAASLEVRNRNAARTLQQLSDVISETQNTFDHYSLVCKQQRLEMDKLYLKKTKLEELVEYFKINNEEYVKVRENVKQEVESTIVNPKQLLKWVLSSLIEFLRKDPSKLQLLYYQMPTETTIPTTSSQLSTSMHGNQYYPVSYMVKLKRK